MSRSFLVKLDENSAARTWLSSAPTVFSFVPRTLVTGWFIARSDAGEE